MTAGLIKDKLHVSTYCEIESEQTFTSPFSLSDLRSRSRSLSLLFFFLLVERSLSSLLRSLSSLLSLSRSFSRSLSFFFSFLWLHTWQNTSYYYHQLLNSHPKKVLHCLLNRRCVWQLTVWAMETWTASSWGTEMHCGFACASWDSFYFVKKRTAFKSAC